MFPSRPPRLRCSRVARFVTRTRSRTPISLGLTSRQPYSFTTRVNPVSKGSGPAPPFHSMVTGTREFMRCPRRLLLMRNLWADLADEHPYYSILKMSEERVVTPFLVRSPCKTMLGREVSGQWYTGTGLYDGRKWKRNQKTLKLDGGSIPAEVSLLKRGSAKCGAYPRGFPKRRSSHLWNVSM